MSEENPHAPTEAFEVDTQPSVSAPTLGNPATRSQGQQQQQQQQQQPISPAVAARVPSLQRLPELSLDEAAHAQECYATLLGERKECISNTFELRILLGQLGLYPSEAELNLVVKAARQRVTLATLTRYLRFCKREFEVAALSSDENNSNRSDANRTNESADGSAGAGVAAARLAFSGGAARGPLPGDADTLLAFVALGGNEDGTGEVSTARLVDVVRSFQLTIDMPSMIASVDVNQSGALDYGEFCLLWSIPDELARRHSLTALSTLASDGMPVSRNVSINQYGYGATSGNWNAMTASHRQMVASVGGGGGGVPGSCRNSTVQGLSQRSYLPQSRRRSSLMPSPARGVTPTTTTTKVGRQQPLRFGANNGSNGTGSRGAGATTTLQPLGEEDRLQLLRIYLMPEVNEPTTRKARLVDPPSVRLGGDNNSASNYERVRLPSLNGVDGRKSSRAAAAAAAASGGRTRNSLRRSGKGHSSSKHANSAGDGTEDVFSLQKSGNGVYQPPSPMILFQRSSAARRTRTSGGGGGTGKAATTSTKRFNAAGAASHAATSTASSAAPQQQQRGTSVDRKGETY